MLSAVIVDDDKIATQQLADNLERYGQEHECRLKITTFSNPMNFLQTFQREFCDVVFLDIEMPMMDGLKVSQQLRAIDEFVPLVFVSKLQQFVGKGYAVEALDFVIKPISYERLCPIMKRVLSRIKKRERFALIRTADGIQRVRLDDILYLEVQKNHIYYHTEKGTFVVWGSLKQIEKDFPSDSFFRCNSCYLVNLKHIKSISGNLAIVATMNYISPEQKRNRL